MKGKRFFLRGCAFFLLLFLLHTVCPAAVPKEPADVLHDALFSVLAGEDNGTSASALLPSFLSGTSLWEYASSLFTDLFSGYAKPLTVLFALIAAASLVQVFSDNLGSSGTLIGYASLAACAVTAFSLVVPLVDAASEYLAGQCAFMSASSAGLCALAAAEGQPAFSASTASGASLIISLTEFAASRLVLPCARTVMALSVVSAFSLGFFDVSSLLTFLKNACTIGLGVLFTVFAALHTVTLRVAAGTDSLALKSLRFVSARLIPVAGPFLSDSLKTVLASFAVIRANAGALGIAYLLYALVPPLAALLTVKFILLGASMSAKLLGVKSHALFFDALGASLNILIALAVFSACGGVLLFASFMQGLAA